MDQFTFFFYETSETIGAVANPRSVERGDLFSSFPLLFFFFLISSSFFSFRLKFARGAHTGSNGHHGGRELQPPALTLDPPLDRS